jgi:hypothetical protein
MSFLLSNTATLIVLVSAALGKGFSIEQQNPALRYFLLLLYVRVWGGLM